ncbi:hypothetical protein J6590_062848 [Homalodisca vitripennis]|nr:hypothetical protein J6590_062848 [Homalodisca vitripennis]
MILEPLEENWIPDMCVRDHQRLISPLPPRNDLPPDSPIHNSVLLVNKFNSELCQRRERVRMTDLSGLRKTPLHGSRSTPQWNGQTPPGQRVSEGAGPPLVVSESPLQCCPVTGHTSTKTCLHVPREAVTNGSPCKDPSTTSRRTTFFWIPTSRQRAQLSQCRNSKQLRLLH